MLDRDPNGGQRDVLGPHRDLVVGLVCRTVPGPSPEGERVLGSRIRRDRELLTLLHVALSGSGDGSTVHVVGYRVGGHGSGMFSNHAVLRLPHEGVTLEIRQIVNVEPCRSVFSIERMRVEYC